MLSVLTCLNLTSPSADWRATGNDKQQEEPSYMKQSVRPFLEHLGCVLQTDERCMMAAPWRQHKSIPSLHTIQIQNKPVRPIHLRTQIFIQSLTTKSVATRAVSPAWKCTAPTRSTSSPDAFFNCILDWEFEFRKPINGISASNIPVLPGYNSVQNFLEFLLTILLYLDLLNSS